MDKLRKSPSDLDSLLPRFHRTIREITTDLEGFDKENIAPNNKTERRPSSTKENKDYIKKLVELDISQTLQTVEDSKLENNQTVIEHNISQMETEYLESSIKKTFPKIKNSLLPPSLFPPPSTSFPPPPHSSFLLQKSCSDKGEMKSLGSKSNSLHYRNNNSFGLTDLSIEEKEIKKSLIDRIIPLEEMGQMKEGEGVDFGTAKYDFKGQKVNNWKRWRG